MNAHIPPAKGMDHAAATHCLHRLMDIYAMSPEAAVAVADAFLERTAAPFPEASPMFSGIQAEADWWADCATDTAIAAMLSACLRRLVNRPTIAPVARKRAMAALWQAMPPNDRAAFLRAVAPQDARA